MEKTLELQTKITTITVTSKEDIELTPLLNEYAMIKTNM